MDHKILREWRLHHKLTQAELAELLDVCRTTVGRWEAGGRRPPWRMLELALRQIHSDYFQRGESNEG